MIDLWYTESRHNKHGVRINQPHPFCKLMWHSCVHVAHLFFVCLGRNTSYKNNVTLISASQNISSTFVLRVINTVLGSFIQTEATERLTESPSPCSTMTGHRGSSGRLVTGPKGQVPWKHCMVWVSTSTKMASISPLSQSPSPK